MICFLRSCLLWLVLNMMIMGSVHAEGWSFSPMLGLYGPVLEALNETALTSPLSGTANILDDEGNNIPTDFSEPRTVPPLTYGVSAGIEFALELDDSNAFVIGAGTWEGETSTDQLSQFPMQGFLNQAVNSRQVKLSYNQYYLGWKHFFFQEEKKYRFYSKLTFDNLIDLDFREDNIFLFLEGPAEGFKRISVTRSQTTAVFLVNISGGGEYFLSDRFSLSLEGGYVFGINDFTLRETSIFTDVQSSDGVLALRTPLSRDTQGLLTYLREDGTDYEQLEIRMDGWRMSLLFSLYY